MRTSDNAFPVPPQAYHSGMTLRDYFAAKALAAMIYQGAISYDATFLAKGSYAIADAMLQERKKDEQPTG